MCKKDSDEIETFRNFYKRDILFENMTSIINDSFINTAKDNEED